MFLRCILFLLYLLFVLFTLSGLLACFVLLSKRSLPPKTSSRSQGPLPERRQAPSSSDRSAPLAAAVLAPAPIRSILSKGRTDSASVKSAKRVCFREVVEVHTVDRWIDPTIHVWEEAFG